MHLLGSPWFQAALAVAAVCLLVFLLPRRRHHDDLGFVSGNWIAEHHTSHGRNS